MIKQTLAFLWCAILIFTACKKTSENNLLIRIQNSTPTDFKEVSLNEQTFTNVQALQTTSYKTFNHVVDLPFVRIVDVNNDTSYVGLNYIDPPVSYLPNGKYSLQIYNDTSTYYGYNCKYIKE